MKTGATSFFYAMRMACFALLLSATAARCQLTGGIFAQNGITLLSVMVDSFDSSDPNHSIWQSNAVFRANYFSPGINYGIWSNTLSYVSNSFPSRTADVTVFTDSNVVDLSGNVEIAGYIATGPGAEEALSANSSVGDLNWCFNDGDLGLQPGHWIQNANLNFHSYPLPSPVNPANGWMNWSNVPAPPINSAIKIGGIWWYTNGVWTNIGGAYYTNTGSGFDIGGTAYTMVITNRLENTNWVYYSMGMLTSSIFIDAQYVVLYLTNGWSYSGRQVFTLNTNADIQIWTSGNISISSVGTINNLGNYMHAFSLYDVAGSIPISVSLGGNAMATGFYYLPSSSLALGGGGNAGDFVGSIICYNFSDGGHVNIHSDDSLSSPFLPWIIQQPTNQIVPLGSDVTFSVTAGGSLPAYQWYFVSTDSTYYWPYTNSVYAATNLIPGATDSSLTITNVQLTNEGYYGVVITNPVGSVTSYPASLTVYTNAAPVLSGMFSPTNGQFQLNVSGVAGLDYMLEASTNLVDWVPLWTNTSPFSYAETNTEAYPQRFYRSVFIP